MPVPTLARTSSRSARISGRSASEEHVLGRCVRGRVLRQLAALELPLLAAAVQELHADRSRGASAASTRTRRTSCCSRRRARRSCRSRRPRRRSNSANPPGRGSPARPTCAGRWSSSSRRPRGCGPSRRRSCPRRPRSIRMSGSSMCSSSQSVLDQRVGVGVLAHRGAPSRRPSGWAVAGATTTAVRCADVKPGLRRCRARPWLPRTSSRGSRPGGTPARAGPRRAPRSVRGTRASGPRSSARSGTPWW